ncbi:Uncharacterised protein [Mycobacteroides abscessus subsp. abscessus]|nr:Uncharacterised protein [Mycobacteroides abscessus subsp. abscessus]
MGDIPWEAHGFTGGRDLWVGQRPRLERSRNHGDRFTYPGSVRRRVLSGGVDGDPVDLDVAVLGLPSAQ